MDKNTTYETYEYLPANSSDTDQFFVVQDDGTFLINRQVQYVTQVQDVKHGLDGVQSCRVYDVTPEQLLVDVDNSTELISVSDQFILPEGGSNLYPNSFLIQPESSMPTQQMEQTITVDQYKQQDPLFLDVVQSDKPNSNCTEITLSDEQYQMLEQKGWILLETNDKIYLLDTLGLHDITTNNKLIHKLKMESQNNYNDVTDANGSIQLESNIKRLENVSESLPNKDLTNFNNINEVSIVRQNSTENLHFGQNRNDEVIYSPEIIESTDTIPPVSKVENEELKNEPSAPENQNTGTQVLVIENDDIQREGTTLKIKTKLSLKNFPEKIVLGKTSNGKQLVARVVKPKPGNPRPMEIDKHEPNTPHSEIINGRKWEVQNNSPAIHLSNLLNETEFLSLIQHLMQNNITKCCADDIVSADSVIAQLLKIPAFKSTVIDSFLVVTKTIQNEDSLEKTVNKGLSAVITGKVSAINDQLHFVYLPYMLQNMIHLCVFPKNKNGPSMNTSKQTFEVLHVQISESKQSGTNVVKVSVTVNKRSIPMDLIANVQKHLPTTMYACSACAALFKTEDLLKEHQMNHCSEHEDMLTIDTDDQTKTTDYCVVDNGKIKSYACTLCNTKFNKLNVCKNHLKTHAPKENDGNKNENKSNEVYKCNMCPCTYFHPSTLSKHILSRHIKMKS